MSFHHQQRDIDQQHKDAIRAGLPQRPHMNEFRGFAIDHISFIRDEVGGDRTYQVQVTAWDDSEEKWLLIWAVQTGTVEGHVAALYWLAL